MQTRRRLSARWRDARVQTRRRLKARCASANATPPLRLKARCADGHGAARACGRATCRRAACPMTARGRATCRRAAAERANLARRVREQHRRRLRLARHRPRRVRAWNGRYKGKAWEIPVGSKGRWGSHWGTRHPDDDEDLSRPQRFPSPKPVDRIRRRRPRQFEIKNAPAANDGAPRKRGASGAKGYSLRRTDRRPT